MRHRVSSEANFFFKRGHLRRPRQESYEGFAICQAKPGHDDVLSVAYAAVARHSSAAYVRPKAGSDDIGLAVAIAAIRKSRRAALSSPEHPPHTHEP